MNALYVQALMRDAQRILDRFQDRPTETVEDRRALAAEQYVTAIQDEVERLDRLIQMLDASIEIAEVGDE